MAVAILDPLDEGVGVLDLFPHVLAQDKIVPRAQQFIRYSEVEPKLLVYQDDVIGLIDGQDAVNCRLGLRLQQCSFKQQRFLPLPALRNVAHVGQQHPPPAERQCRQTHLSRKSVAVFSLVQPFETLLAVEKRCGYLLFDRRSGGRAVGLVRR